MLYTVNVSKSTTLPRKARRSYALDGRELDRVVNKLITLCIPYEDISISVKLLCHAGRLQTNSLEILEAVRQARRSRLLKRSR
jgi:hypothetical protein